MCCFHQAGRTRRSHAEDEGQVMTKGSVRRTTPAVAASERRKSLKLVRRKRREKARGERSRLKHRGNVREEIIHVLLLYCTGTNTQEERCRLFFGFHYFYSSLCLSLQDCLLGSARCVLFQCPLHNFSGQAVLKINARLWNSSFIEVKKPPKNKTSLSSLHQ